jgi:hypothetical protein
VRGGTTLRDRFGQRAAVHRAVHSGKHGAARREQMMRRGSALQMHSIVGNCYGLRGDAASRHAYLNLLRSLLCMNTVCAICNRKTAFGTTKLKLSSTDHASR